MLSWRLWQSLLDPVYKNPIFKRITSERRFSKQTATIKMPRYISRLIVALILLVIVRNPYILLLFFQIPAVVIMGIVLTPVIMPYIVMLYGGYMVSKITTIIHKEKRQYTYDLLCASPDGTLRTNWILATGIVHRGEWFYWAEGIGRFTYRVGQIILLVIAILTLATLLFTETPFYFESLQTLIDLSLLLGLYYTSLMQTFVLIILVGLYATSFDLRQRDSGIVGVLIYFILLVIPYLMATALSIILHTLLPNPHPAVAIGLDCIVLGSLYVTQELNITLVWHQLTKRLNARTSSYTLGRVAPLHS